MEIFKERAPQAIMSDHNDNRITKILYRQVHERAYFNWIVLCTKSNYKTLNIYILDH